MSSLKAHSAVFTAVQIPRAAARTSREAESSSSHSPAPFSSDAFQEYAVKFIRDNPGLRKATETPGCNETASSLRAWSVLELQFIYCCILYAMCSLYVYVHIHTLSLSVYIYTHTLYVC